MKILLSILLYDVILVSNFVIVFYKFRNYL